MEYLQCRVKEGTAQGKPRVYFTCHPADFERTFDRIRRDIFQSCDCAIYYTEDMRRIFSKEEQEMDLNRMNLFVIPVTSRLLKETNRAMDLDLPYAVAEKIPVLPIMLETGIEWLYSRPDRFGNLQYLDRCSRDATEIPYERKLKNYLDAALFSNELAEEIRGAFDGYIFLSYRKKDRRLANDLMRRIHSHTAFRDIAIWYDELLTPGEDYNAEILAALQKSAIFAVLVTPNLVGEKNYVQSTEYPDAQAAGKTVLAVEMEATDGQKLRELFPGVPDPVDGLEEEKLRAGLLLAMWRSGIKESDSLPARTYLIGLAYLDGIDVEVNRERGLALITDAAKAGVPRAMEKLADMYENGIGVPYDYQEALRWREKVVRFCLEKYGESDRRTLQRQSILAAAYGRAGERQKALQLEEKLYPLLREALGDQDPLTVVMLGNLAASYRSVGNYRQAISIQGHVYHLLCQKYGERHVLTLRALEHMAATYNDMGEHQQAFEVYQKVYQILCETKGEEDPDTMIAQCSLAHVRGELEGHQEALGLYREVYQKQCRILGNTHPDTLQTQANIGYEFMELGNVQLASRLLENAHAWMCEIFGEEHPRTLTVLENLSHAYLEMGDLQKALDLAEKICCLSIEKQGIKNPDTLRFLNNFAGICLAYGVQPQKAAELMKKAYEQRRNLLGEAHEDTLCSHHNLAEFCRAAGDNQKAIEYLREIYEIRRRTRGEDDPKTVAAQKEWEDAQKGPAD